MGEFRRYNYIRNTYQQVVKQWNTNTHEMINGVNAICGRVSLRRAVVGWYVRHL